MSYKTKFDGRTDKTIKLGGEGNPSSIEGYFLGSKDTQSDYGPGKLHLFQTSEGVVGVWGKTRMNTLLTNDHRGQMVLLSFTGMIAPSKKGRRPSYGYKLQYDPENTIDVSNIDLTVAEAEDDGDDDTANEWNSASGASEIEDSVVSDFEEEVPVARPVVAPRVAAAPASADRQAKMQALLNSRRASK